MRVIVVAAAVAMVVLVLAASSGRFDVWRTPVPDLGVPTEVTDPPQEVAPQEPAPEGRREWPRWLDTATRAIAVVVAAAAIAFALSLLRLLRVPSFVRYSRLRRKEADGEVLPEFDDRSVVLDVASARAALAGGTPRNAIVACWMQLERDAADAGLPRTPSETPTEYAERVIGASSVDRAPIAELAALYREARFSRHELSDDHRQRALVALERVAVALQHDARESGAVGA
jgi:hypothetical protein